MTIAHRGAAPETRFSPPYSSVRANLESFARAAAGGPAYAVSLDEMEANVRTFEAITRSAASGAVTRIY